MKTVTQTQADNREAVPAGAVEEPFLVFGAPCVGEEEIAEVVATVESRWLGTGPRAARFEEEFRLYKQAPHSVALNSCTAALHLALVALDLEPGDEVITTPLTFASTVNSIIHAGGTPVLADVDPLTMNIDPAAVAAAISPRTRAILPVHFAGRPCEMDALLALTEKHSIDIIEDCAHAIETSWRGRRAGTFGRFGCFSFYATKNLTTAEGGMLLARSEEDADRLRILALHGMSKDAWKRFGDDGYRHYYIVEAGFKYNMTDLQAAIGLQQLRKIDRFRRRRQEIWDAYLDGLSGLPIRLPAPCEPDTEHALHLFTICIDSDDASVTRDEFLDAMTRHRIGVGVHYLSIPEHPYYQERFGWHPVDVPQATRIGRETVSLPLMPSMTDDDVARVIRAVRFILQERSS